LLAQAARLRDTTLTEFPISSAMKAAEDAMARPKIFEIGTDEGWAVLTSALDDEPPSEALVAALRDARRAVGRRGGRAAFGVGSAPT